MKNDKLVELYRGLISLNNLVGVKVNYAILKNINILKPEIEILDKSIEFSPEYKKYDEARIELCEKYAKKNKLGESIISNNQYEIEDIKSFDKDSDALKKANKTVIDNRTTQLEEYKKLLDSDNQIVLYKISINDIPENITTSQMNILYHIITD